MYRYAQLDDDNNVVGISDLSGAVDNPNLIKLEQDKEGSYITPDFGDIWHPDTKSFEYVEKEPEVIEEPEDPIEEIKANQFTTMEAIGELYMLVASQGVDMGDIDLGGLI